MSYTRLCSGLLFPLHERLKRHDSARLRRQLEASQWLPAEELEAVRLQRLKAFLLHVSESVPYYRRLFAEQGFEPRTRTTLADLACLPRLTKALIRQNVEQLKSMSAGRLIRYSTGGSSGEPLVFFMGQERVTHDVAAKWRATRWWNVDIGDPEIVLWGSPIELTRQDRIKSLRDRIFRTRLLPAFEMSERRMSEYLVTIRGVRPRMLFGYPSALAMLASHARASMVKMRDIGIRVVFTTGETLYPEQRQTIEEVFGAPVANGYGSRDAGFIAHQCPAGSLHVSAEHVVVELLDEEGHPVEKGQMGEVVVTHLATSAFPFIRYRTGDMATLSKQACPCGRSLEVLGEVFGRSTDFIRTRSGNAMHALALIYEVRDKPGVRAFKFVQAQDLAIELQLVTGPELLPENEAQMLTALRARLGTDTPLAIRKVEHIAPEKSGKYRYVVSYASTSGRQDAASGGPFAGESVRDGL